jgi:hypothetical protein
LNENVSFEEYINDMSKLDTQGDNATLIAAAQYYKLNMINLATNNFFKDIELSDYSALLEEDKI